MDRKIVFPPDVVFFRNLMLQRTNILADIGGQAPLARWMETGATEPIDLLHADPKKRAIALFQAESDYRHDAAQLLAILPTTDLARVVSVGPGNGLLELLLMQHFNGNAQLLLIDIEQSDSHHHGFHNQGAGYASLRSTIDFLSINGIEESRAIGCNPLNEPIPNFEFDLLISILSMGFHYPCDDYVNYMINSCAPNGMIVVDKRIGSQDHGFSLLLDSGFNIVRKIDFQKYSRVLLQRI